MEVASTATACYMGCHQQSQRPGSGCRIARLGPESLWTLERASKRQGLQRWRPWFQTGRLCRVRVKRAALRCLLMALSWPAMPAMPDFGRFWGALAEPTDTTCHRSQMSGVFTASTSMSSVARESAKDPERKTTPFLVFQPCSNPGANELAHEMHERHHAHYRGPSIAYQPLMVAA